MTHKSDVRIPKGVKKKASCEVCQPTYRRSDRIDLSSIRTPFCRLGTPSQALFWGERVTRNKGVFAHRALSTKRQRRRRRYFLFFHDSVGGIGDDGATVMSAMFGKRAASKAPGGYAARAASRGTLRCSGVASAFPPTIERRKLGAARPSW